MDPFPEVQVLKNGIPNINEISKFCSEYLWIVVLWTVKATKLILTKKSRMF